MIKYNKISKRVFPKKFKKVSDYIFRHRGIRVLLGTDTIFTGFFQREIIIHYNYDLEHNGLIVLLFEIGKSLQSTTNTGINSYKLLDINSNYEKYQLGHFLKELNAWEIGWQLSKKLKLKINKKEWDAIKKNHLSHFFKKNNN